MMWKPNKSIGLKS